MDIPSSTPELHAEVAALAARAGLSLDDGEIDSLAVPYGMMKPHLAALHDYPFGETEPILVFDARFPESVP